MGLSGFKGDGANLNNNVAKILKDNNYPSDMTLTCAVEFKRRLADGSFEGDLEKDIKNIMEEFNSTKEKLYGSTREELAEIVGPEFVKEFEKNAMGPKTRELAVGFYVLKWERKELRGSIRSDVQQSIDEALIYVTNVDDKDYLEY